MNAGLPPTPIALPGEASLDAAIARRRALEVLRAGVERPADAPLHRLLRGVPSRPRPTPRPAGCSEPCDGSTASAIAARAHGRRRASAIRSATRCRPAIHNAAFAATGPGLGLRGVPGRRPGDAAAAAGRHAGARAAGAVGDDAAQGRRSLAGLDRLTPVAAALGCGQLHRPRRRTTRAGGRQHRRRRVPAAACGPTSASTRRRAAAWCWAPVARPGRWCWRWPARGGRRSRVVNRDAGRGTGRRSAGRRAWVGRSDPADVVRVRGGPGGQRHAGRHGTAVGAARRATRTLLHAGQVVAELVYHPLETPLLGRRPAPGRRTANGVSMLVHQAAVAFERWTGQRRRWGRCRRAWPPPSADRSSAAGPTGSFGPELLNPGAPTAEDLRRDGRTVPPRSTHWTPGRTPVPVGDGSRRNARGAPGDDRRIPVDRRAAAAGGVAPRAVGWCWRATAARVSSSWIDGARSAAGCAGRDGGDPDATVFELLRFDDGSFVFDPAPMPPTAPWEPVALPSGPGARPRPCSRSGRAIEEVVPSMSHRVGHGRRARRGEREARRRRSGPCCPPAGPVPIVGRRWQPTWSSTSSRRAAGSPRWSSGD